MKKGNTLEINLLQCSVNIGVDKQYNRDICFEINTNNGLCKVLNITEEELQRKVEPLKYLVEMFCNQLKQDINSKSDMKKAMGVLYIDNEEKSKEKAKKMQMAEARMAIKYYTKILNQGGELKDEN